MKKRFIATLILTAAALSACTVYAEPLAELEGEGFKAQILGADIADIKGERTLVGLFNYENTSDAPDSPDMDLIVYAYLNGVELERTFHYDFEYEGYKEDETKVTPGTSIPFYALFELPGDGEISLQLSDWTSLDGGTAFAVVPDIGGVSAPATEPAMTESQDQPAAPSLEERVAQLEKLVQELEERLSALEG